jgi:hypothetical protein
MIAMRIGARSRSRLSLKLHESRSAGRLQDHAKRLDERRALRDDRYLGVLAMRTLRLCRMPCAVLAAILVVLGTLTATAQSTSSKLVASDIRGHYALIKSTISSHREWYYHPDKENTYGLADCGALAARVNSTDVTTSTLGFIAALYYKWMTELPAVGYPGESVAPLIQDYEKTLLQHVISKGAKNLTYDTWHREGVKLANEINDLRSRQHLNARQVEYEDECGGPGAEIRFIIPKDAHMFMIISFDFELCQKQGINPKDRVACDRYFEVQNGPTDKYSALYIYVGEWKDGYARTGQIDAASIASEGRGWVFRLTK